MVTLVLLPGAGAAAEPEALDAEFLEYLAEFESDDDNWTWFSTDDAADDTAKDVKQKRTQPPAKREEKVDP